MNRCKWCNENNPKYIEYHDHEWGVLRTDDHYLCEMLILESFQAGLSWECVLNKREAFRAAYDNFDLEKVCAYGDAKVTELLNNKNIIRNRRKIVASIKNSQISQQIVKEYDSFYNYLKTFLPTNSLPEESPNLPIYETGKTTSEISDAISEGLRHRGMIFVGSTIIYSYLQAVGIIYSHDDTCDLYKSGKS